MITRVMREREYHLIQSSMRDLDDALGELEISDLSPERIAYIKPRIEALIELAESFAAFLNMLLNQAEANIKDLRQIMGQLPE